MRSTIYYEAKMGFPFNVEAAGSFLAARENGSDTAIFHDIEEVPLNRANMLVASIQATHKWFTAMDWNIPAPMTYPDCFLKGDTEWWFGRRIQEVTLKHALENIPRPFFIKPKTLKQFAATVIDKQEIHSFASSIDPEEIVYVSDIVDFISEWRVYVLDGKAVGCCNYNGDFLKYPGQLTIGLAIKEYKNAPRFYSLDVGILATTNRTHIVECNGPYSLGNYGLNNKLYHRCLMVGWREILEQNPVKL